MSRALCIAVALVALAPSVASAQIWFGWKGWASPVANAASLPTCDGSSTDHIRWAQAEASLYHCDGSSWSAVSGGGGGGGATDEIVDADADTSVQVEATSDDDTVRVTVGGTEVLSVSPTAILVANGFPVYFGDGDTGIREAGDDRLYLIGAGGDRGELDMRGGGLKLKGLVTGQLALDVPNGRVEWVNDGDLEIYRISADRMAVASSGVDRLIVEADGAITMPAIATAPACSTLGGLYTDTSGALCWCDGTNWSVVQGAGSCT